MKELLRLNKYIYRYKWRYLLGAIFIIGLNFFSIYTIRFVGKAIDFIQNSFESTSEKLEIKNLLFYGGLIILLPIISGILQFLMRQTIIVSSRLVEFDLKNDIFKHYQILDTTFYKNNRIGDLMNRISEDVGYVRMYLGPGIMYPINLTALSIILIIEMLSIDKTMTLFTLLPLPILSVLVYLLSSRINKKSREVQAEQSNLSSYAQDVFSGIRVIKAFNKKESIKTMYAKKALQYKNRSIELANINAFFSPLMLLVIGLSQIMILYVGGMQFIEGKIKDIGTLAQFFMYLNMLIWPFTSLGWVSMVIQRAEASMKRINEFISSLPEITNTGTIKKEIEGDILFDNVTYTYSNTGITALDSVSFHLPKKKTLAIMGKTGSGKTTLVELISRLFDTTSGTVKIDNKDIKKYDLFALRQQIGVVPQEAFLFSHSIYENLGFSMNKVDLEHIKKYAKKADVHKNIIDFQQGYNTKIGERGVTLSGGQKQRISIARALIKEPKILIFDDSLSAVDTETEKTILNNLKEESQDKTMLIITHRISSAKNADYILILNDGKVEEFGTHEELMKNQKEYYQLHMTQTK